MRTREEHSEEHIVLPEVLETKPTAEFSLCEVIEPTEKEKIALTEDEMVAKTMNVLKVFEIDEKFSTVGVGQNLREWNRQKEDLRKLFRKHKGWSEKEQAIFLNVSFDLPTNEGDAREAINRLVDILWPTGAELNYQAIRNYLQALDQTRNPLCASSLVTEQEYADTYYRQCLVEGFGEKLANTWKVSTRHSRMVRKIIDMCLALRSLDDDTKRIVERQFAIYANAITPRKKTEVAVLSLNFNDFLLMSNGNSWASCHYINTHGLFHNNGEQTHYRGMYRRGTLSYAEDNCSFLFYTIPGKLEEDNHLTPKIDRMCCQYRNGFLITGKCYPANNEAASRRFRHLIQDELAKLEEIQSKWRVSFDTYEIAKVATTAENAGHYPDYEYEEQNPARSVLKPFVENKKFLFPIMTIGAPGFCVCCGERLNQYGNDGERLACDRHMQAKIRCVHCGRTIDAEMATDEWHRIDDEWYCDDCCFYCDFHKCWEAGDQSDYEILSDGTRVCEDAIRHHYFQCAECHEWHLLNDLETRTKNGWICRSCAEQSKTEEVKNGDLQVKPQYEAGDLVVIGPDLENTGNLYGTTGEMYNLVGTIVQVSGSTYLRMDTAVEIFDPRWSHYWKYARNAILGVVVGADESMIGKKYEEVFPNAAKITE